MVKRTLRNGTSFFFKQQGSILSGAAVIGLMLLTSAVLGLVRKRLYASIITPGPELDAFFAAFRLPDILFQLLVAGSLNAAFIPLFSEQIGRNSKDKAWGFASSVLNLSLVVFLVLGGVIFLFAQPLSLLIAPGFNTEQTKLLASLMRILALSPIFLGVSSFISGIIQSFRRFLVPFLSPIIYNLGAILGILLFYPLLGLKGAAWGVVIGSLGHLLIQLPLLRHLEFKYVLRLDLKDKLLRKMVRLSIPRSVGLAAEQIKVLILINLASLLSAGAISFFELGQSVVNVPVGVLGVSIAQASFPRLAFLASRKKWGEFKKTLFSGVNQILFLTLPVSVILIVLKIPVVRLVYGTGRFGWSDTRLTSWVIAFFALGLFAQAVSALLIRAFYSLQDTKTPVITGIISMVVTLVSAMISLGVIDQQRVKGLALAVSIGAMVELVLLAVYLKRRVKFEWWEVLETPLKIVFAAAVMAVSIYVPVHVLDQVFLDTRRVVNLLILMWLVLSFGGTVYLLLIWFLGVAEIRVVLRLLWKLHDFKQEFLRFSQLPVTSPTEYLDENVG